MCVSVCVCVCVCGLHVDSHKLEMQHTRADTALSSMKITSQNSIHPSLGLRGAMMMMMGVVYALKHCDTVQRVFNRTHNAHGLTAKS